MDSLLTTRPSIQARLASGARCGGSLVVEVESRRVRLEQDIDWYADRPRRGRPPNALRALRARMNPEPKVNA